MYGFLCSLYGVSGVLIWAGNKWIFKTYGVTGFLIAAALFSAAGLYIVFKLPASAEKAPLEPRKGTSYIHIPRTPP